MESEYLLTIDDVAARLRVHRSYVYTLIGRGELPKPLKIGKASRIRATELDRAIRNMAGVTC
jgi:excisionase family DNA binding protein